MTWLLVSGPARYASPSTTTLPKPPLARLGDAFQVAVTFHDDVWPLVSRARARNA